MGTIAVSRILDRVSKKLFDEARIRWLPAELLGDYNALKNTIAALKPDAFVLTEAFTLLAGSRQTIPATAIAFRRLTRNIASGTVIRIADRDDLDHARPSWHAETGAVVLHYVHDAMNPRVFYVYPSAAGVSVEGVWSATPADAATEAAILPLDDLYEECLFFGIMAASLCKNFKSLEMNRVNYYQGRFNEFLGLKSASQYRFAAKSAAQEQAAEMPGGNG